MSPSPRMRPSVSLALVIALAILVPACAHSPRSGETLVVREGVDGIQVTGDGDAEARPDLARFRVGIEARRPTVAEARDASAAAQTRVLDALRAAGAAAEDLQTTQLSIQPEYQYTDAGQQLLGYTARNMLSVRVRDLERLAEMVDGAIGAGGNDVRLDGIEFEHSSPEALRAEAREEAMTRARSTAEQLARLAGVELGEPIAIEEAVSGGGPRPMMMEMRQADAAAATPIEPGTIEVQVQLRVRWSIR